MSSERRELENRLETLILHLLKWDHQPDQRVQSMARNCSEAADAGSGGFSAIAQA